MQSKFIVLATSHIYFIETDLTVPDNKEVRKIPYKQVTGFVAPEKMPRLVIIQYDVDSSV